jgi:hypothetical protein
VQVTTVASSQATTELFTAMVQDGRVLLDGNSNVHSQHNEGNSGNHQMQTADLIVHAAGSQDNFRLDRKIHTMDSVKYQEHQRRVQQDFIRASLHSQPCGLSSTDGYVHSQPAVVYLDDYLYGQGHESIVADTITARVIHQLIDYYPAAGLVSYASVVNRLVMADADKNAFATVGAGGSLNYGKVPHIGVLWTLLFAALEYTVDYCSHVDAKSHEIVSKDELPLITPEVLARVATVPPPYLDGNTSLVTVSQQWKQEEKLLWDRRYAVCGRDDQKAKVLRPSCALAVTASGNVNTKAAKNSHAHPLNTLPSFKEAIGWKLTDTGTLRATRTNSQAPWSVEAVVPKNQTVDHVQVFVVREDTNKTRSASAPLLQVKAIIGGDGDREYSVEVQATHNSDARVALPVRIDVQPPATAGVQIRLELRLIKGETVDIEGVFAC